MLMFQSPGNVRQLWVVSLIVGLIVIPQARLHAQESRPAEDTPADAAEDVSEPKVHHLYFVITRHAVIHAEPNSARVIDRDELIRVIEEASLDREVRPHFWSLNDAGVQETEIRQEFWTLYKKLYDEKRCTGSSWGSLSPRAWKYWDEIRSQEDLTPDPQKSIQGKVLTVDLQPVSEAHVFLLPDEPRLSVYLQSGRVRNFVEEHLVSTNSEGGFEIAPTHEEYWIIACHPTGFAMGPVEELDESGTIQLKPWAKVSGQITTSGILDQIKFPLSEYPIHLQSKTNGVSFHIYETEFKRSGEFQQPCVPPGTVQVGRSFKIESGGSMSFFEFNTELIPGQSREIQFEEMTESMKANIQRAKQRPLPR